VVFWWFWYPWEQAARLVRFLSGRIVVVGRPCAGFARLSPVVRCRDVVRG
jgi:hypothetical protein